jgi:hypothetical protein
VDPGTRAVDALVVGVRRVEEAHLPRAQPLDRRVDVLGRQRDVLDALAVVGVEVLLDLRFLVLRLVDGDADLAAGAGERAARRPVFLPWMSK